MFKHLSVSIPTNSITLYISITTINDLCVNYQFMKPLLDKPDASAKENNLSGKLELLI